MAAHAQQIAQHVVNDSTLPRRFAKCFRPRAFGGGKNNDDRDVFAVLFSWSVADHVHFFTRQRGGAIPSCCDQQISKLVFTVAMSDVLRVGTGAIECKFFFNLYTTVCLGFDFAFPFFCFL